MKEHENWHNLFKSFMHFKKATKEHVNSTRIQLKLMANRYLSYIKKLDAKNDSVKIVPELMESLLPAGDFKEIGRLIDAIGKERIKLPHKIGFFQYLFGLGNHKINQGIR